MLQSALTSQAWRHIAQVCLGSGGISGGLVGVMVSTLIKMQKDVGWIHALGAIFSIFITPIFSNFHYTYTHIWTYKDRYMHIYRYLGIEH